MTINHKLFFACIKLQHFQRFVIFLFGFSGSGIISSKATSNESSRLLSLCLLRLRRMLFMLKLFSFLSILYKSLFMLIIILMFLIYWHFTACLLQSSRNEGFFWLLLEMRVRNMRLFSLFALNLYWFSIFLHFSADLNSWSWFVLSYFWYVGDSVLFVISLQRNSLLFDIFSCFFVFFVVWFLIKAGWFSIRLLEYFARHLIFFPCLRVNEVVSLLKFRLSHIRRWQRFIVIDWPWSFVGLIVKVLNFLLELLKLTHNVLFYQ